MRAPLHQLLYGLGLLFFLFGTSVPNGDDKEFGGFSWEFTPITHNSKFDDIFSKELSEGKHTVEKEQAHEGGLR